MTIKRLKLKKTQLVLHSFSRATQVTQYWKTFSDVKRQPVFWS